MEKKSFFDKTASFLFKVLLAVFIIMVSLTGLTAVGIILSMIVTALSPAVFNPGFASSVSDLLVTGSGHLGFLVGGAVIQWILSPLP